MYIPDFNVLPAKLIAFATEEGSLQKMSHLQSRASHLLLRL
jgi:hypothetical protein